MMVVDCAAMAHNELAAGLVSPLLSAPAPAPVPVPVPAPAPVPVAGPAPTEVSASFPSFPPTCTFPLRPALPFENENLMVDDVGADARRVSPSSLSTKAVGGPNTKSVVSTPADCGRVSWVVPYAAVAIVAAVVVLVLDWVEGSAEGG